MVAMVFFKLKEEGFQKFTYSLTQPRSQIQQEGKAVVKISLVEGTKNNIDEERIKQKRSPIKFLQKIASCFSQCH